MLHNLDTCTPQAPKPATQAPKATTAPATKAAPKATAAPATKAAAKPRAAAPKPEPSSSSPSKVVRVKKEYALPGQTRDTPEEVRLGLSVASKSWGNLRGGHRVGSSGLLVEMSVIVCAIFGPCSLITFMELQNRLCTAILLPLSIP